MTKPLPSREPSPRGLVWLRLVCLLLIVIAVVLWLVLRPTTETTPIQEAPAPANPAPTLSAPVSQPRSPVSFRPVMRTQTLQVLENAHFTIGYDNSRKNPAWVAYDLDGPISFPGQAPTRPATFATDFRTSAHVAHRDYSNSGYDRGHLWPAYAAWSRYGSDAFKETFICSNIIPQLHSMNAGIWETLEAEIAGRFGRGGGWADRLGHLTVINGPVYDERPERLRTGITIPAACFSNLLDWREDRSGYRSLAFQIPNREGTKGPLARYLTSIKAIEDATGLDVFAGPASIYREGLETTRATELWR